VAAAWEVGMAAPKEAVAVEAGATVAGSTVGRWVVAAAAEEERVARAARAARMEVRQTAPAPGMSML